jgi:hypothetical protein
MGYQLFGSSGTADYYNYNTKGITVSSLPNIKLQYNKNIL